MNINCPCDGGQSCIVQRRVFKDKIYEDDIFTKNNIPLRKNCYSIYTKEQYDALLDYDQNIVYNKLS